MSVVATSKPPLLIATCVPSPEPLLKPSKLGFPYPHRTALPISTVVEHLEITADNMSGTASTSTPSTNPKSPVTKPQATLSAAAFTRPICGAEDDVWRCSICGWEIETDDGVRGFCSSGHRFDCTNIPGFEALDEDPAGDETGSVASGESWDEYESDGLVEDDLLANAEARIRLVLRDVDRGTREVQSLWKNPLDGPLLLGALDAIAEEQREAGMEGDGGFALLIKLINTVKMEEDEEEGSAEEETEEQSNDEANEEEEEEEDDDEIYMNRDGDSLSITEAFYETSDEEDVSSYEVDGEDDYESSDDDGSRGEYEGDSEDEKEDENAGQPSVTVEASAQPTKAEDSPALKKDDTVAKLESTIVFLTQLLKDTQNPPQSSQSASSHTLPVRTTATSANDPSPAPLQASDSQTNTPESKTPFTFTAPPGWYDKYKTLVEPDGATPKQDLLFNPEKIKSFMEERTELLQQTAMDSSMGDRKAEDLTTELEGCGDDLCEAVNDARIERNAQMGRMKPKFLGFGGWQKENKEEVSKDGKCGPPQLASSFTS